MIKVIINLRTLTWKLCVGTRESLQFGNRVLKNLIERLSRFDIIDIPSSSQSLFKYDSLITYLKSPNK